MSLQTVHKSLDQQYTIAFDDRSGKFFLCRFNFDTGKYAKLHRHGTDYETVVFLSQAVHNHSIIGNSRRSCCLLLYRYSITWSRFQLRNRMLPLDRLFSRVSSRLSVH